MYSELIDCEHPLHVAYIVETQPEGEGTLLRNL